MNQKGGKGGRLTHDGRQDTPRNDIQTVNGMLDQGWALVTGGQMIWITRPVCCLLIQELT